VTGSVLLATIRSGGNSCSTHLVMAVIMFAAKLDVMAGTARNACATDEAG